MRRQLTGFSLMLCGLWIILGGLVSLASAPVASATPRLAPSPRPTIERPTAVPQQAGEDHSSDDSSSDAAATGRLTGTIIDTTTGAPSPGVTVIVGGVQVTSDANGNYDTWLPVGNYTVGLVLAAQQGADILGPQAVVVRGAGTTVQHMYFRSLPAPTASVEAAPAAPGEPAAAAGAAEAAPAQPALRPTRLPVTSLPSDTTGVWLGFGAALVVVGLLVGVGGRRSVRRAAQLFSPEALLASLLSARLPATTRSDEALLRSLLSGGSEVDDGKAR
jgi:hypothetical protein